MQFSTKDDDHDYHQGENCPKNSREVGATEIVMGLILMVGTLADHTRLLLMVSIGIPLGDIIIPSNVVRWK